MSVTSGQSQDAAVNVVTVNIPSTVMQDLRVIWRMRKRFWFESRALQEMARTAVTGDLSE